MIDRRQHLQHLAALAATSALPALAADDKETTFDEDSIVKAAADFFGQTT